MSHQQKNKIRSLFLLIVFSLNTVAGFACSVGVNMGYNTKHHVHTEVKPHSNNIPHSHGTAHQHKHLHKAWAVSGTDDCCTNEVAGFIKLDKSVGTKHLILQIPFFLSAFATSYVLNGITTCQTSGKQKFLYWRRWRSFNDTDIRIRIQSFQI